MRTLFRTMLGLGLAALLASPALAQGRGDLVAAAWAAAA